MGSPLPHWHFQWCAMHTLPDLFFPVVRGVWMGIGFWFFADIFLVRWEFIDIDEFLAGIVGVGDQVSMGDLG